MLSFKTTLFSKQDKVEFGSHLEEINQISVELFQPCPLSFEMTNTTRSFYNQTTIESLCTQTFGIIVFVPWSTRLWLTILNIVISMVTIISNTLVMVTLVKTKQLRNQSMKLIFALSLTNALSALLGQSCLSVLMVMTDRLSCFAMWILLFVIEFAVYNSNYLTALISIDRFLRIRFKFTYHQVFSNTRFKASLVVLYLAISLQTSLGLIARVMGTSSTVLTTPVNALLIGAIVYCYVMSIFILKRHQNQIQQNSFKRFTTSEDKTNVRTETTTTVKKQEYKNKNIRRKNTRSTKSPLTKLPVIYVITLVIFTVPIMVAMVMLYITRHQVTSQMTHEGKGTCFYSAFIFFFCYHPTNAIFFLVFNKYSRSKINSILCMTSSSKGRQGKKRSVGKETSITSTNGLSSVNDENSSV